MFLCESPGVHGNVCTGTRYDWPAYQKVIGETHEARRSACRCKCVRATSDVKPCI